MRTAGRWIGKVRRVSAHFRTGIDAMVREAELADMEKKWRAQNEEIMRRTAHLAPAEEESAHVMTGPPPAASPPDAAQDALAAPPAATPAPAAPAAGAPPASAPPKAGGDV
jgi:sec-independent protein translocase protein TatB